MQESTSHQPQRNTGAKQRFSDEEAQEIYRRAAQIESKTLFEDDRMTGDELLRGANRAGISQAAIERAIQEREADQKRAIEAEKQAQRNAAKNKTRAMQIGAGVLGALVLGTLWTNATLSSRLAAIEAQTATIQTVSRGRFSNVPRLIRQTQTLSPETATNLRRAFEAHQRDGSRENQTRLESQIGEAVQILQTSSRPLDVEISDAVTDGLKGAENRMRVEERKLNGAIAEYNRAARSFPRSIFRPLTGKPGQYAPFSGR